jgi:predicted nucleotidyltransferase
MTLSHTKRSHVERICRRWPVARLALFGSHARGTARPTSDYDLVVDFERDYAPTLFDLGGLQSELTAALGAPVDLLTRHSAVSKDFLKDAQILFERN